jgi:L-ribulose-5-phosphate 3-epimerase
MNSRIGFMQGRLSPLIDGRIQAFPWPCWQEEFRNAREHGFGLMEWTLDQERLYKNPLMTVTGQAEISELCQCYGIVIPSLTGDCFMQAPFWKTRDAERETLKRDFIAVVEGCTSVGISFVVVPLVDSGRLENVEQEEVLVEFLRSLTGSFAEQGVRVVFESDFAPAELARFIARLDPKVFGINYDIGNSAGMGFNPVEEFAAYGERILNVHVKDRVSGGTTVPLGTGSADFSAVFSALGRTGYCGNYILQTARANNDDHSEVLCRYRDMTAAWINHYGA